MLTFILSLDEPLIIIEIETKQFSSFPIFINTNLSSLTGYSYKTLPYIILYDDGVYIWIMLLLMSTCPERICNK